VNVTGTHGELQTRGWAIVEGIESSADLLELGMALGYPVPSPNGEMVKEIRITKEEKAMPGSQSALYGTGPFPLHTDTVFWPTPVRYVILRGYGDTRRPTTLMSFSEMLRRCGAGAAAMAANSIWTVREGSRRFFCSLKFRLGGLVGWRYDADLMSPANHAAIAIRQMFEPIAKGEVTDRIFWSGNTALVLSNWQVLHGRGPEPSDEGPRIVERLYVR